jgi:hypothetical protein
MNDLKNELKKYLAPLWIFAVGMILMLISFLFYPAIGAQSADTLAKAGDVSRFWGVHWELSSTRLILFIVSLIMILISAMLAFRRAKRG